MIPPLWWALLAGNFAIGCGVMVVPGSINDLVRSLEVAVPVAGQLVTISAVMLCLGAPAAAAMIGRLDRRILLTGALLWYAAGHALAALVPGFGLLLPLRAVGILGAAVFTPQAAAAIGILAPPGERGRAITFIFLGWSLASVAGLPLANLIAESLGWRWAFGFVAVISAAVALWVSALMPRGVRPSALSLASWTRIFTHPGLLALVAVTACSAAGQFTLFAYMAPYYRDVLDARAVEISLLFLSFGAFGLAGNVIVSRWVDRVGAGRCVAITLSGIALTLALWPLAHGPLAMAAVCVPWALGCFSSNSAQQARFGTVAPALTPALMALNTSAMYLGQAIGAGAGGLLIAASGFGSLSPVALGWVLLAIAVSLWGGRRLAREPVPG